MIGKFRDGVRVLHNEFLKIVRNFYLFVLFINLFSFPAKSNTVTGKRMDIGLIDFKRHTLTLQLHCYNCQSSKERC